MKQPRIYVDTSVVGGCFDKEFEQESRALFEMARLGSAVILVSDTLIDEIELAPERVQKFFAEFPEDRVEFVPDSDEAESLCASYLAEKILGKASEDDALHVALATVARADILVSWNFKHIVHLDKIRGFNDVNLREGYAAIEIRSPREVV